jgi:hypothetical protein
MQKDIETLTTLNHDFVKSVQGADVKRFDEILAKDFLFTNPDGSLYNRAEFLDLIGKGARISELCEDQVNVLIVRQLRIVEPQFTIGRAFRPEQLANSNAHALDETE